MENKVSEPSDPKPSSNTINRSVRKAPVVRQTLASKLRLELGNKLLFYKNQLEKNSATLNTTTSNINLNKTAHKLVVSPALSNHYDFQKGTETKSAPRNILNKTNNSQGKIINNVPNATKTNNTPSTKRLITKNVPSSRNYENATQSSARTVINKTSDIKNQSKIVSKNVLSKTSDIKDMRNKNVQTAFKITSKIIPSTKNGQNTTQSTARSVLNKTSDFKTVKSINKNVSCQTNNASFQSKTMCVKNVQTTKFDQSKTASKVRFSRATLTVDRKMSMSAKRQPIPEIKPKKRSPLRKSLSAMHFKRVTNLNRNSTIHRATSWSDVSFSQPTPKFMSPINESKSSQIVFRTPSLAKRRSVNFSTPLSNTLPSPYPMQTPSSRDLKERLSFWLHKLGKPIGSFHHLRCFDLTNNENTLAEDENKENIEKLDDNSESYEDLRIPQETSVANDILFDLHKLIAEGYPRNQCEAWLQVIRGRFAEVEEHPQYWECRAALEEARGDLTSVLECYQNAIIKGAKVKEVDDSLESLFKKFQILNISPKLHIKQELSKAKLTLDARNAFKSKMINFAIQERTRKKTDKSEMDEFQFIATPVRRSTRISRGGYVSTPGIKLYKTLDELDSPTQKSLKFKTNKALHV